MQLTQKWVADDRFVIPIFPTQQDEQRVCVLTRFVRKILQA